MIAYLLTWTTYGTWLHGDARGSMDRKRKRPRDPDPVLEASMRERMKHAELTLDAPRRKCVRDAIEGYCQFKQWHLYAINVRTNHVHVVVGALGGPQKVIGAFKARATRMLRDAGLVTHDRPVWTAEGGEVRRLLKDGQVVGAVNYVLHEQGDALP